MIESIWQLKLFLQSIKEPFPLSLKNHQIWESPADIIKVSYRRVKNKEAKTISRAAADLEKLKRQFQLMY